MPDRKTPSWGELVAETRMAEQVEAAVTIVNKRGLHARASAKFVSAVAQMEGSEVRVSKDGGSAAGGSILGLMMLGAARGDCVQLQVSGESAEERLAQLVAMIEDGFGED